MPAKVDENSMAGRGRSAMLGQFIKFWAAESGRIVELQVGKDYWLLFNLFAEWLETRAIQHSNVSEKGRNITLAKTLRDWDGWVWVVDKAAERMVFDTFHPDIKTMDTIPTPSPTGEGKVSPRPREAEEGV